jgi:SAM-dependent methyltransferase
MSDPFGALYDDITARKAKAEDFAPYTGGNGRIDRAVDLILNEDFPRSGTLLDVGGATGNLGFALRESFERRYTYDIAAGCREAALKKGNIFIQGNADVNGLEYFQTEEIDLIVALDFIEHIINPEKFARECMRVLKPGGVVLINTPNIQFWRHLESLVCRGIFPHTSGDREVFHGGHVAFYNYQDLMMIFSGAGFVQMQMHTRGLAPEPPPPIWMNLLRVPDLAPNAATQLSYADLVFSCGKRP